MQLPAFNTYGSIQIGNQFIRYGHWLKRERMDSLVAIVNSTCTACRLGEQFRPQTQNSSQVELLFSL